MYVICRKKKNIYIYLLLFHLDFLIVVVVVN